MKEVKFIYSFNLTKKFLREYLLKKLKEEQLKILKNGSDYYESERIKLINEMVKDFNLKDLE